MSVSSRTYTGKAGLLRIVAAFGAALFLSGALAIAAPCNAHAVSQAEQTAFDRSVKAICNYQNEPTDIVVDVSDLRLSRTQLYKVYERVRWDGHYFWVNPFGEMDSVIDGTKSIKYHCAYSDANITKMRARFNAKIRDALKWAPAGMSKAERVHMLHDWFMKQGAVWTDSLNSDGSRNLDYKLAYGSLVLKKGDCLSFALAMRVLLDEAGFQTDYAYINTSTDKHSWTRVKLGGVWYNIDSAWDNTYTRNYPRYWSDGICHMYLLVNDWVMEHGSPQNFNDGGHPGFIANYKNTSKKHASKYLNKNWSKTSRKWMKVGSTFKCGSFTYKVKKGHKVVLWKCNKKSKKTLTIPAKAAYRGHTYKITGIASGAFAGSKCKTLVVKASSLTKSGMKKGLLKSKVKRVQVKKESVNASAFKKYKKCFKKSNSGKKVKLSYK